MIRIKRKIQAQSISKEYELADLSILLPDVSLTFFVFYSVTIKVCVRIYLKYIT